MRSRLPHINSSFLKENQKDYKQENNDHKNSRTGIRAYLNNKNRYIYNDLVRRTGAIVFSSCQGNEVSYENAKYENGIFTEYIIRALNGEGDINNDGYVTTEEIQQYVSSKVSNETKENALLYPLPQHPTVDRDNIQISFGFKL